MKKILLVFLLFCSQILAKEQTVSNIAPAGEIYVNLEPGFCDEACLNELLKEESLASFLARFEPQKIASPRLLEIFESLGGGKISPATSALNQGAKIAVIIPQKTIKSYANIVTNALIAYAARSGAKIELKFINSTDEGEQNIANALNVAREQNAKYIVAPFTPAGANTLNRLILPEQIAFIPTLHASLVPGAKQNLIFGGADYAAQIKALMKFANEKVVAFSDGSALAGLLNQYVRQNAAGEIYEIEISGKEDNLGAYLNKKSRLNASSMFLNLPLIKASSVATQIRGYEIAPFALLSSQINFVPQIFSVVAKRDRQNLYLASSINLPNDEILGASALFDLNLRYDWIAYSTIVGVDYLYSSFIDPEHARLFSEPVQNSQIVYGVKIFSAAGDGFGLLGAPSSEGENFTDKFPLNNGSADENLSNSSSISLP